MSGPRTSPQCGDNVAAVDAAGEARHMLRALALAERGRGRVEPNPVVGAVLVRDEEVVGEGFHARFGGPHAEVEAIAAAGARARGATLFVTLEPCNHTGKTGPCTEALLAAGVRRVVYAIRDPHAIAAGGAERLRAAGVEVDLLEPGPLAADARRKNAPFLKLVRRGLPFVTLKWAMTLDGKTATRTGDSRWVSSGPARRLVHEARDRSDAVLVGIRTALADDPELTTRLEESAGRTALRVVVDARARLPLDSALLRTIAAGPVLVAATEAAPEGRVAALRRAGAEVLICGSGGVGVDLEALLRALVRRERPVTNLLVEGGGRVTAAFLDAGLADRVMVFVAPKIAGGANATTPVEGEGRERMADALAVARVSAREIGPDLLLEGELRDLGEE
jgi:diaminohydroxyphosphoribosylaminopyrimidine deaminase/5-amino-6-(5-phosphoribosylamino)uracil reductase